MSKSLTIEWDTKSLCDALGTEYFGIIQIDTSKDEKWDNWNDKACNVRSNTVAMYWNNLTEEEKNERMKNHGMTGKKHSKETKIKMRKSSLGKELKTLHKGGIVEKNGVVVKFSCISHFCDEHNLSKGHMTELLQGKRNSVKGWKKYGV